MERAPLPADPDAGADRAAHTSGNARRDDREVDEPASSWEGNTSAELVAEWGVPALHLYRRVGSTSDRARHLAAAGAPAGSLVLADEQFEGRGRAGRGWSSPPGLGLWFSLIARPTELAHPGALPILLGLTVAQALDQATGRQRVRLKWPNDLVLQGRKLGGILCEGVWEGGSLGFVVVGIGINVLHLPSDFPPQLASRATSLRMAGGRATRLEVASSVIRAVHRRLRAPLRLDTESLRALAERDLLRDRLVTISDSHSGKELGTGIARGIDGTGALQLQLADGRLETVVSGTARLLDQGAESTHEPFHLG